MYRLPPITTVLCALREADSYLPITVKYKTTCNQYITEHLMYTHPMHPDPPAHLAASPLRVWSSVWSCNMHDPRAGTRPRARENGTGICSGYHEGGGAPQTVLDLPSGYSQQLLVHHQSAASSWTSCWTQTTLKWSCTCVCVCVFRLSQ